MTPLPSLPLDVLLVVLRDLDIVDVVRIGMTCKDLREATQDRHVWVDQLEKLIQKDPALGSATPPLTSLSAQELKTFVTGRVKLRLRWDKDDGDFVTNGLVGISGVCELRLLPGGKSMVVVGNRGGVTLRRIELEDGQVSLPVVANVNYEQKIIIGVGWSKLLTAMSPCPILVHKQGNNVHLLRVDHHNDAMGLETTFPIPEGYSFLRAHGQGRVVGFLIQRPLEPPRAVVLHLDYPGVSMEPEVSPTYDAEVGPASYMWNICIPTENLVIIHNTRHILAYKIPNFSSLSLRINFSRATPMWYWPGPEQTNDRLWIHVSYMTSEALYDPPSAQGFNLHYVCQECVAEPYTITITIPINIKDDPAYELGEQPALEQKSTPVQHYRRDSVGFSFHKGLHSNKELRDGRINILVTPLDDLVLEGGRKALRISVPCEEHRSHPVRNVEVDIDEATGRVVIWRWDGNANETKVFVGDLV